MESNNRTQNFEGLKAIYVNCSLKPSAKKSNTDGLMEVSRAIARREGVNIKTIRLADYRLPPGMMPDMSEDGYDEDPWPQLFEQIIEADILVVGTPIWLGQVSSVAKRFMERMDAMSAKLNKKGQSIYYGKVAGVVITGNEDGAKHCAMEILYSLQHLGYSIPPQADAAWLGEVGPGPSYLDEEADGPDHEFTNKNSTFMTYNLLHLASMLKSNGGYSSYGNDRNAWKDGERWNFKKLEMAKE
jgi:multimeric flavodoxin WrbA